MTTRPTPRRARLGDARGQSIIEMALVLPLSLVMVLGVIEVGYALLDQHVVTKLTREGSNLISRDVTLADAGVAMRTMTTRPVDFNTSSKLIFSVLRKVSTTSAANYGFIILYQRHEFGAIAGASTLTTAGTGTFGAAPEFQAINSDNNTNLRITNIPANLDIPLGGLLYVTEVFQSHPLITPLGQFGVSVPPTLHSIAFF